MCDPDPSKERAECNRELHGRTEMAKQGTIALTNGGFGYSKRSGREGHAGGGSKADGVPRTDVAALEHQVQEDCTRVAAEASQPMGGNHSPGSGLVDSSCLVEGIWLSNPGRGHGNTSRKFCRG